MKQHMPVHATCALLFCGIVTGSGVSSERARTRQSNMPQAADSTRLVITEVLFAPVSGDTTFIELANTGTAAVELESLFLLIDTLVVPLPRLAEPLPRGARVLIRFDGRGTVEGNVAHIGPKSGLPADDGAVAVFTEEERLLDRVAWGAAPGAIMPPRGGLALAGVVPGSTFGRPPGAERPGAPGDWVIYPPEHVTPGQPNPLPAVVQLLPLHGARLPAGTVQLGWYPVPGAVRYRIQLAVDTTFTQPLLDEVVAVPRAGTGERAAGTYWWRVQSLPASGPPAPWSPASRITLEGSTRDDTPSADEPRRTGPSDYASDEVRAPVLLDVPLLVQHKDSPMLLLESQQSGGPRTAGALPHPPHTWDGNHQELDPNDPADRMNCALASIAMLNNFYNGDLVQDRIGYEVFSSNIDKYAGAIQSRAILQPPVRLQEKAPGPERDLNYDYGLSLHHIVAAGLFALGGLPGPNSGYATVDTIWNVVVREIGAGRPLLGFNCCHVFVIRGYELLKGERLLYINDPWSGPAIGIPGQYSVNLDTSNPQVQAVDGFVSFPSHSAIGRLEPNFYRDSDRDDVSDFDEIHRFHTDPANADTDNDGVRDKQDIESGVYELEHMYGYAWNPAYGNPGRDLDRDGVPPELDPDSDNGGCKDGDEDTDADGYHTPPETGNFDDADDMCAGLQGVLSYRTDFRGSPQSMQRRHVNLGVIRVRVKPEPGSPGLFVDDSSTFTYRSFGRTEINYGTCIIWSRGTASGSGMFVPPDSRISLGVADDGTVAVEADISVQGRSSAGTDCGPFPSGSGTSQSGSGFPDCQGKEVPGARLAGGAVSYRFDCDQSLTLADGSRLRTIVRGYLQLVIPPLPP